MKSIYNPKANLDTFYKILTGQSMDEETNPAIKEHFLKLSKEILMKVLELRLKTGKTVIQAKTKPERLDELFEDAIKRIKDYETSKEK